MGTSARITRPRRPVDALPRAGLGGGLQIFTQRTRIQSESALVAVRKMRHGAAVDDGVCGGDEGQRGNEDFVARLHPGQA